MAENLEDLNRQLEEAQQKVVDSENLYSSRREQLSKMGEEHYKTTMLTIEEQENVIKEYKKLRETLKKEEERRQVLNKALDEETKIEKQIIDKAKQEVSEIQKKIEEAKKPNFWQKIGFKEPDKDDLATQYRARQMAGGVEAIMEGRFGSGARQILSTFPKIANFMGGPYFLALQAVTSGLLKLDSAIAKARQEVLASTGGVFSPFRGDALSASLYRIQIGEELKDYGFQDKAPEIMGAAYNSTGLGAVTYSSGPLKGQINPQLIQQRAINQGAALRYMGSLGISDDSINNLLRISRNIEGQSEAGALATQYRLAERFRSSRYMTENEGIQQSLALYEQTKSLGVNFEWASRTVRKFDDALQKGEATLNDFAAISRGVKSSDLGRSSGLAAMLKDFAARTGMELPEEFLNASDQGAGFYLTTRKGISDPRIQKALVAMAKGQSGDINFGSTSLDAAAALQYWLSQGPYKANVSSDQIQKVINTGDWSSLIGGRSGVKPEVALEQSEKLQIEAKDFYKEQRSVAKAISEGIGTLMSNLKAGILVKVDNGSWGDLVNILNPMMQPVALTQTFVAGNNALNDNGTTQPAGH